MAKSKTSAPAAATSTSDASSSTLDQISNFTILPLHMPSLTTTTPSSTYKTILHYLYFKKHESPKEDPLRTPKNRTLFVLNLPTDATEAHFRELFRPYGRVASVHFMNRVRDINMTKEEREQQEELERIERETAAAAALEAEAALTKNGKGNKKNAKKQQQQQQQQEATTQHCRTLFASGSQAYVVFLEEPELSKVLAMKRKKRSWTAGAVESSLGVAKWMQEYHIKRPAAATLQIKVDDYMEKFERSEYEAQQAALARLNVMDDDGFTLVTRAGKGGHNTDGVITVTAAKAEDVKNLKPKKKELQDFYRFQMREAKRDKLVDLRRKFEEDKLRIEALKVNRRFKPY